MKKGEIYEGTVERIEFPNKGVVVIDGEKAIVKNALPGQKIRFRINKKRGGRCEGMLLEVVEHSKLETAEDVCPHFGICGGCLYQPIPYEEQLAIKEKQVRSLLDAVCPEYEFEGILGSPLVQGYRNKMEFSFGDEVKDGPMSLGMHKRGSFYDVVTTGECHIVHPDFCKILVCTKEYFEEKKVGFYKKMQHTGYLRHLLVRRAIKTGEILVDLITTTQTDTFEGTEEALLRGWTERLQALPMEGSFAGILHTKNDTLADAVKDEGTDILFGREHFYEELLGLRFQISPFSFFQTNSLGAEVLYEKTREYVGETKGKVVFDLYSGTGTIAQILAPVAEKVVGVEIVGEAVEAARENAARNGLGNCEFLAGDVLKVVDELEEKPDLIVLAGFLVVIPAEMIAKYRNRMINIHPSLIPAFCGTGFYGLKVHEKALERGVKVVGATVHFVDEGTDTGPIILQKAVEVEQGDTPEVLQRRVMEQAEWRILPRAIDLIANGKVKVEGHRVTIES